MTWPSAELRQAIFNALDRENPTTQDVLEWLKPILDWRPIETAPKGRKIIAGYFNESGKWRSVMACYYLPKTLDWNSDYDGGDEDGFAPEGWYEEIENTETIFPMQKPTHWQPLREPPAMAAAERAALLG